MATKNPTVQTRVTPEVYSKLDKIADNFDVTVYSYVSAIINNHVKRFEIKENESEPIPTLNILSVAVNNTIYEWLYDTAKANDCCLSDVIRHCIMDKIKALQK